MTQALAQARKALENVLPTLDDLAKYRGLSYSEAQSLAVDVRSALAAIDAALGGGAVPKILQRLWLLSAVSNGALLDRKQTRSMWRTLPARCARRANISASVQSNGRCMAYISRDQM